MTYTLVTPPATMAIAAETAYKIVVPDATGHIYVELNSTSSGAYLYGKSFSLPTSSYYNCYTSSYDIVDTYYIYSMFCYTPRAGEFYIMVEDSNTFTGSIKFNMLTCGAGMGGYNCTFPSIAVNATSFATGMQIYIPYTGASDYLNYAYYYMYMDIMSGLTAATLPGDMTVSASGDGSYMYVRRGGFPEDSSTYGYEDSAEYDSFPATFGINNFEFQVPGRIYFAFECYSTPGCNVTVSANVSASTSATSVSSASSVSSVSSAGVSTTQSVSSASSQGSTTSIMSTTRGVTTMGVTTMTTTAGASTTAEQASSSDSMIIAPTLAFLFGIFALLF